MTTTRSSGPWRTPTPTLTHTLTRWLARHRRALAAGCAGLSVAAIVAAASPAPEATTPVLVAARPIAAGSPVRAADLRTVLFPRSLAPADAYAAADPAVGRTTAVALSPGTPVTRGAIVGAEGNRGAPGRSLVPARLSDPAITRLVRVGDRVDVLALDHSGPAKVVARGARVAAMPEPPAANSPLGAGESGGPVLLFEVDPESAGSLAQAAAGSRLGIVLRA